MIFNPYNVLGEDLGTSISTDSRAGYVCKPCEGMRIFPLFEFRFSICMLKDTSEK